MPVIESIEYPNGQNGIIAGKRQTLIIHGKFFGNNSSKNAYQSRIQMKDGERIKTTSPLTFKFSHINNEFVKSWTRNKIEIEVPSSIIYEKRSGVSAEGTPVSGPIKITNHLNMTKAYHNVDVKYALLQEIAGGTFNGVTIDKRRLKAQNKKRGLTFNISKKVANDADAMRCIRTAFHKINCKTGMNLRLNRVVTKNNKVGENVIYYSNNTGLMSTIYEGPPETTTNGDYAYYENVDIAINPNQSWYYDIKNSSNTGSGDFYQAFLHELGHVAGLQHSLNPASGYENLMHPAAVDVNPRHLTYKNEDKQGIKDMLAFSIANEDKIPLTSNAYPMEWKINQSLSYGANDNGVCVEDGSLNIRGISLSSKCAQDYKPYLMPRIEGGEPPYYYEWSSLNNMFDIEGNYAAHATFSNVSNPSIINVELTVEDANGNTVTKSTQVGQLDFGPNDQGNGESGTGWDLGMRIQYNDDYSEEYKKDDMIWESVDVWNRRKVWKNAGFSDNELDHQTPYHPADNSDGYNAVNVRIMNVGCEETPSENILEVFVAHSDYLQNWPDGWIGVDDIKCEDGSRIPAGKELTGRPPFEAGKDGKPLQKLDPGERVFYQVGWNPPDPNFCFPNKHFCILARTVNPDDVYPTSQFMWDNVRQYNHFVVKNVKIVKIPSFGKKGDDDGITGGDGQTKDVDNNVVLANNDINETVDICVEYDGERKI